MLLIAAHFLIFLLFLIPNFFIISFLQFLFKFIKIKNWIFFHLKFSRILVLGFDLLTFNPPSPLKIIGIGIYRRGFLI